MTKYIRWMSRGHWSKWHMARDEHKKLTVCGRVIWRKDVVIETTDSGVCECALCGHTEAAKR